jgi:hypothetical protein
VGTITSERLNVLNDFLFFKVMGEKGDEEQLQGFLNAVLGRTGKDRLVSVEILGNRTFTAEVIGDKSSILDIRNDALHRWLSWFNRDSPPELIEEIIRMDTAIQEAEKKVAYVSSNKEALRAYQMREMALSDWVSGVNHARREGRQEGLHEKEIDVAKKALGEGASVEFISKITGLDVDTIKRL